MRTFENIINDSPWPCRCDWCSAHTAVEVKVHPLLITPSKQGIFRVSERDFDEVISGTRKEASPTVCGRGNACSARQTKRR